MNTYYIVTIFFSIETPLRNDFKKYNDNKQM